MGISILRQVKATSLPLQRQQKLYRLRYSYTGIKQLYRPLCNHGNRKQQYNGTVMVLVSFKTNGRYQNYKYSAIT